MSFTRATIRVTGTVQGVGFRPFVYRLATELDITGDVANTGQGVVVNAYGSPSAIAALSSAIAGQKPVLAVIRSIECIDSGATADRPAVFRILQSSLGDRLDVDVTRDTAICPQCLAEMRDPANRRYRHPFIACTECGPRYSIITTLPYDRPNTVMARFPLCPECQSEYEAPASRRFHAQTICCHRCGPRLILTDANGGPAGGTDPLATAVGLLADGAIVAIKGLGGFHLACRADDSGAVRRLRERKYREEKPLAVMARDLQAARQYAHIGDDDERLLLSPESPIVICPRLQGEAPLAAEIAPGIPTLGIMLPYTPLHHLLFDTAAYDLLVMTSGNRTDESMVTGTMQALEGLGRIADYFLMHDRDIHVRVDDSIVRTIDHAPVIMRRGRGHAPEPLLLPRDAHGILACGGIYKTTAAICRARMCYLSQYIGSAENLETYGLLRDALGHLCRLLDVTPTAMAGDLHPESVGERIAAEMGLPYEPVQHHFAHAAACLAEHGITERSVCVVYDGTGYGDDGTIWGGEILLADLRGYERAAHLAPMPMPGAEAAIRHPGRMAMGALHAVMGNDVLSLCEWMPPAERAATLELLATSTNCITTSSMGRLFDSLAALLDICRLRTYEGQPAIEVEGIADQNETGEYPWHISESDGSLVMDGPSVLAHALQDLRRGAAAPVVSARVHNTIARLTCEAARRLAPLTSSRTVCLTGGCFQNALLAQRTAALLRQAGLQPLFHRLVPPNDGGISYGQVAVLGARRAGGVG